MSMTGPTPMSPLAVGGEMWTSNTTLAELADWLASRRQVVVLTHSKPDGDAVGSSVAAARAVALATRAKGGIAVPWYFGPLPAWIDPIVAPTRYRHITEHHVESPAPGEFEPDAILIVDTGTWTQVDEVRPWLASRGDRAAVIDHHRQGDPAMARRRVVTPEAAAVAEPVAELCRLLLGVARYEQLPVEIAEPLYLGIATDTGWFRHSNVNPGTLRLAASLLEAGVDHSRLYALSEQQDRDSRVRLMGRALASLQMFEGGRIAVVRITNKDFHETKAEPGDSGGFTDPVLRIASVQVAVALTETFPKAGDPPMTKVSIRSKEGPDAVDVSLISKQLGGGGHARAAGAKVKATLEQTQKMVLEALR
jgi:phosphoesterase RecJ-like protein